MDIKNNSNNDNLFAKKLLHKLTSDKTFIAEDNINNYNIFNDTKKAGVLYQNISNAVDIYNDKSINTNSFIQPIKNLNDTFSKYCSNKIKIDDACKEIWFTIRLLALESDNKKNSTEDSVYCRKIKSETHICSHGELQNLTTIKSQMNQRFANYFYNERNVISLGKSIESFVSGLNNFFTASLLAGPGIFLAYMQRKSKNK